MGAVGEGDRVAGTIVARQGGEPAVDPAGEQGHTLVGGRRAEQGRHGEGEEVVRCQQLLGDDGAVERGVGRLVGDAAVVIDEAYEAGVLDAV